MALISNKKAYFNYEIVSKIEAGIELLGFEVKSVKKGSGSLDGSYVVVRNGEVFLTNLLISPYQKANTPKGYDEYRPRRLLMHKREIKALLDSEKQKGLTAIPLSLYNKGGKIKVEVAIARGKKKYDKRETLKKRDSKRDIARTLKNQ